MRWRECAGATERIAVRNARGFNSLITLIHVRFTILDMPFDVICQPSASRNPKGSPAVPAEECN